MYKIGEFSKIVMLSVKTLRYYHDIDLLVPCTIDEDSGYRFYDNEEYEKALVIKQLKELQFTLSEIKEILDTIDSYDELSYYFVEKAQALELQIREVKKIQKKLGKLAEQKEEARMSNTYDMVTKTTESLLVASIRYTGRYDEMGTYFEQIYKVVGRHGTGQPAIVLFHDEEYMEENAQIEICVPIKNAVTGRNVDTKTLEPVKVLSVTYQGPYETISDGYKALVDYASENAYELSSPSRNIYHKGPGMLMKGNPNKYITEIQFPIK